MFFIFGVMPKRKQLEYVQQLTCPCCKTNRHFTFYDDCMCLSVFFIPFIKWGLEYFASSKSCSAKVRPEAMKRVLRRETASLEEGDFYDWSCYSETICKSCGTSLEAQFCFCPKCGRKLN